jgi:hypothetical protein
MFVYSTCRDCGGLLHVTNNDTVHPGCEPKYSKAERLALEWRDAVEAGNNDSAEKLQQQIDEIDSRPPRLLDAALAYVSWGWPVFPLMPLSQAIKIAERTGEPLNKVAKRPATKHGFKDATDDVERIRTYWTRHPDANIGLPTGIKFDVVDIDIPEGPVSLTHVLATVDPATGRGLLPDAHAVCATASGGTHYYIEVLGGGNKGEIMPGIDIRGAGGYVVAPPSTLGERGRSWCWAVSPSPVITTMASVA